MNTVIVGGGLTGVQLARRLINEKNDVVLIENNEETARHLSNRLNCAVLNADGNSMETLEKAGIQKADALVCVTSSDEVNMITCSLADALYPDVLKIARVRNYAYYVNTAQASAEHEAALKARSRPLYGIDFMVHPDVEAASSILKAVEHGASTEVIAFENTSFELCRITVEEGSALDGKLVKDVRQLTDKPFSVCYVESGEKSELASGFTQICAGDKIGVLTERANIAEMLDLCGSKAQSLRKIALVGAAQIGTLVSDALLSAKKGNLFGNILKPAKRRAKTFVIIDSDEKKSKLASERFGKEANVFNADITDDAFIQEEGLEHFDLAICATTNYELNMVASAYLKSLGVDRTIAVVAGSAYENIAKNIGVDIPIPIRDAVADSIIGHLKGKAVTGIHTVSGGNFETIECVITASSKVCGKNLIQIAHKGEFLVLIVRKAGEQKYQIPVGKTVLEEGDSVLLITSARANERTIHYFGGRK